MFTFIHGLATITRLLIIIGFFCRISSLLQGSFAKATYNFEEPTNRSHPIACRCVYANRSIGTIDRGSVLSICIDFSICIYIYMQIDMQIDKLDPPSIALPCTILFIDTYIYMHKCIETVRFRRYGYIC